MLQVMLQWRYRREAEEVMSLFSVLNDKHQEHPLGDLLDSRVMDG